MVAPRKPVGFEGTKKDPIRTLRRLGRGQRALSPQALVRQAERQRRAAERREFRQYTRHSRRRRLSITAAFGGLLMVSVAVVILTTSPIFSLRTVNVEGISRLDAHVVSDRLEEFMGQPLGQIDTSDVVTALSDLSLVQSVDTRIELPDTLRVTIVERTPLGVVETPAGYQVVDAAAVVLWEQGSRPEQFPLLKVRANPDARDFVAVVRVLNALPVEVLAQVDAITASTQDTVRFTLRAGEHQVLWGSADSTTAKARVLPAALRAASSGGPWLIDLSTPETVVLREPDF